MRWDRTWAIAAFVTIPFNVMAKGDGYASMKACAELLHEAARLADEPQRDALLNMARLYEKAAKGYSGPYGEGLEAMVQIPMPQRLDQCLLDPKQTP